LGLDESFGIEPFREFTVPIFARIDKSINSFVGGIIAANKEHVDDKKKRCKHWLCLDTIGCFSLGLDEPFGIEPFREFNVP
jgi:hypothetical protein